MSPESDASRILATKRTLPALSCRWGTKQRVEKVGPNTTEPRCRLFPLDSTMETIQRLNQQLVLNIKCPSVVDNGIWKLWPFPFFHRSMWWLEGENDRAGWVVALGFRQFISGFSPKAAFRAKTPALPSEFRWGKAFNLSHGASIGKEKPICLCLFSNQDDEMMTKYWRSGSCILSISGLKNIISDQMHHKSSDVFIYVTWL